MTCSRCARVHEYGACPARGKRCRKCNKTGHFEVACKTKSVKEVTCDRKGDETKGMWFLGSVSDDANEDEWHVKLSMQGTAVEFKIDTGADITVMSEQTFLKLPCRPHLTKTLADIRSPGGKLDCIGKFLACTERKGQNVSFWTYVVKGPYTNNLLSRKTACEMKLVSRVDSISTEDSVFGDFGLLDCEPIKIELRQDSNPYSISTSRRVPFPLLPKVEEELQRMLKSGIIEEVTEATDWCAPMVPVIKKNGKVRICVDLKKLNEAVKRERFILPTLEDILPQLLVHAYSPH